MMDTEQEFEEFLEDNYQDNLEMAQAALDRGDNVLALELAEECLEERQLDVEVLNIAAVAATNLDDLPKAQWLFAKALQLDPRNGALHHNYAVLLDRQCKFEQAVEHLERALEFQPDFPEAYINLGNVLDELERTDEALAKYREALRRMPDSHDAYYNIGYACNRLERYDEALESFLKALELFPDDAGSQNGAGYALANLGRLDSAGSFYDRAIQLDPHNATYRFNRGLMKARQGLAEEALLDLGIALESDNGFFDALIEQLALLVKLGRFEEVETLLVRADELNPESPEPPFYRALLAERRGDSEQALVHLEESLSRDPLSLQVLNNKGSVLLGLGRLEEALECFEAILEQDPEYALAHFNRACVLAQRQLADEAVKALEKALRFDAQLKSEVAEDPDFDPIRQSVPFRKLTERFTADPSSC
jgi:tetratricopeptide (TPR) repeat protein